MGMNKKVSLVMFVLHDSTMKVNQFLWLLKLYKFVGVNIRVLFAVVVSFITALDCTFWYENVFNM